MWSEFFTHLELVHHPPVFVSSVFVDKLGVSSCYLSQCVLLRMAFVEQISDYHFMTP